MVAMRPRGPFQPGSGRLPPYLAGREREQNILREFLEDLRTGDPAPSDVVLYGPRGNGKTVLLRWLREEVAARNAEPEDGKAEVETLWFTPSETKTVDGLAARIRRRSWLDRLGITRLGVPGTVEVRRIAGESAATRLISEALAARVRKKPLVLLLDEAHTLDPEVGGALLNASQEVGGGAPFLLVMAGTPNLRWRLRPMSASFWSRARQMPIGRLSEAASRDAVRVPLRQAGIGITEEALNEITDRSHRYPFFLQLWGAEVCRARNARRSAARSIGPAEVKAAATDFTCQADLYYLERYEEFEERGLLPVAWAVADAFGAGPSPRGASESLGEHRVRVAVEHGLDTTDAARVRKATETLFHLGYIWRSRGAADWEPGIPSLMDFIWNQVAKRRPAGESGSGA